MGEITEMILEGILCEVCGTHIGDSVGYARKCPDCKGHPRKRKKKKAAITQEGGEAEK